MKLSKKWIAVIVTSVLIGAVFVFSLYQANTHPLSVGVATNNSYQLYIAQAFQVHQIQIVSGQSNLTLYAQLITPKGNLTNSEPFLLEVNIVVVSTSQAIKTVAIGLILHNFSVGYTSLPVTKVNQVILNSRIFQSTYSSVSAAQPINYFSDFSANVTVNIYSTLGPYYVKQQSVRIAL